MNTPPLMLGASLMFWGWHTGLLALAMVMAFVLEASRLIRLRWDLSPSDFNRISDLCTILFLGMVIYLFVSERSTPAILVILQWLPLTFFPLLVSQVYSTHERINISAFFLTFRRKRADRENKQPTTINLIYPYFALCIISASAANVRTISFYVGLFLLSAWALWSVRSKRFSLILWAGLLVLGGFLGYAGHIGLHDLQMTLEKKGLEWFTDFIRQDADPYRSTTAIGDIGSLKLSDRIVFRVKPEFEHKHPMLLREASYNVYRSSKWFAVRTKFSAVQPHADGTTWEFQPGLGENRTITVSSYLQRGKGLLKLPNGAYKIERLPVLRMESNQFGAVKVEEGPGLMNYRVRFGRNTSLDSPPSETDLTVPKREKPAISRIAEELGLTSKSPREILRTVDAYFQENFNYSLVLSSRGPNNASLAEFLLQTRSGHCEYFATATVLLLRAAGIPARYASGYSVHEFSRLENRLIVRARHAHAWALVYIDGVWRDFDTTPSSWRNIEEDAASMWELVSDLWSWSMFKFSEWRWREREGGIKKYIGWLLIPFTLILARRLYFKKRVKRVKIGQEERGRVRFSPGVDSEFYLIEKRLKESGFVRYPWETLSSWIRRIEEAESSSLSIEFLHSILALHYRYRFDPEGITLTEKAKLNSEVQSWLEQYKTNKAPYKNLRANLGQ